MIRQWERGLRHGDDLVHLNTGIMVSNPTRGMDVCDYSVFALSCVSSRLMTGRSPVQGVLPTVYKIHNFRINSEWLQARAQSVKVEGEMRGY
jgi:hypothetical protein